MEISIRDWKRQDLATVGKEWLAYSATARRFDMKLKKAPEKVLAEWLDGRFRDSTSFGLIAECGGQFAGFLLARVDNWESVPPIVETRKLGMIDGLYVVEHFRRYSVAATLIEAAVSRIKQSNAVAVETIHEASSEAARRTWERAGFTPWMVHSYRMLYNP
jgi:GNAT superfamily N-acetyltransferase